MVAYEQNLAEKEQALAAVVTEKAETLDVLEEAGGESGALADMQNELDGLRAENEFLKGRITELEQAPAEVAELKDRIEKLTSDNVALQTGLEQARSDLKVAASAVNTVPVETALTPMPVSADQTARINELERALRQADMDKQAGLQALAREYIRLKRRVEARRGVLQHVSAQGGNSMQVAALDEPVSEHEVSGVIEHALSAQVESENLPDSDQIVQGSYDPEEEDSVIVIVDNVQEERVVQEQIAPAPTPLPLDSSISEAQRHEVALAYEIQHREVVLEQAEPQPLEPLAPIVVSRSEDPFEDIEPSVQPVRYESLEERADIVERLPIEDRVEPSSGSVMEITGDVLVREESPLSSGT